MRAPSRFSLVVAVIATLAGLAGSASLVAAQNQKNLTGLPMYPTLTDRKSVV